MIEEDYEDTVAIARLKLAREIISFTYVDSVDRELLHEMSAKLGYVIDELMEKIDERIEEDD